MDTKTTGIVKVPADQSKIIWNHRQIMFDMGLDWEIQRKLHFWLWYIEGKKLSEYWLWLIYKSYRFEHFKNFYIPIRDSLVNILQEHNGREAINNIRYFDKCRDEFLSDPRNLRRDPKGYFAGIHWFGWIVLTAFAYFMWWVILN